MFQYILKRVFLFIPTILIISILTNILSQVAPGDPVEMMMAGGLGGQENTMDAKMNTVKTYIEKSKKLGLNLPGFYFSITAKAFPDTLYRVPIKKERKNLKKLINQYGNWPEISAYYRQVKEIERVSYEIPRDSTSFDKLRVIRDGCNKLYIAYDPDNIDVVLSNIKAAADSTVMVNYHAADDSGVVDTNGAVMQKEVNSTAELVPMVNELLANFDAVKENATRHKLTIPTIHWYGTGNQYHRWLFGDVPWFPNQEFEAEFEIDVQDTKVFEHEGYYQLKIFKIDNGEKGELANKIYGHSSEESPVSFKTAGLDLEKRYIVEAYYTPDYDPNKTSKGFLRGDFGESYMDSRPVSSKLWDAIGWTVQINLVVLVLIYILAIPIGIQAAVKRGYSFDQISSTILFILYSLPGFWIATLLITFLTTDQYGMDFFPTHGVQSSSLPEDAGFIERKLDLIYHMILPIFCLTYGSLAFLSKQMRGGMIEVLGQDYIRTAKAKGLDDKKIIWKHAFRNSLIPIITLLAGLLPFMISGAAIIEIIFSIPGMGKLSLQSVFSRDYPVLFTVLMFAAILTMVGVLLSDILYAIVDPRISFSSKKS